MADTRTMSELLQAPTEGYGDAIVLPPILAKYFELKVGLLTLVTSSQFHGFKEGKIPILTPRDALTIIESNSKVCTSRNEPVVLKASTTSSSTPTYLPEITALSDVLKAMVLQNKTPSPAPIKAIEEIYVTCGGPHHYYECRAT
ncbi:hypothetical protein Tco_0407614 [Tanacetum coccineum]